MNPTFVSLAVNLGFALLVASSYILYGFAFKNVGAPDFSGVIPFIKYFFKTIFNPFFMSAMVLSLGGAVLRMAMFKILGIARSAIAAELSLVFMIIFSLIIFQNTLRFPRDYIALGLIMLGTYLVN